MLFGGPEAHYIEGNDRQFMDSTKDKWYNIITVVFDW